jgi:antitoxin MazE
MNVRFGKWGNSMAVRIPLSVSNALKLHSGDRAEARVENGRLIIEPVVTPPTYDIDRLIDGITEANRHGEVDWGVDADREAIPE